MQWIVLSRALEFAMRKRSTEFSAKDIRLLGKLNFIKMIIIFIWLVGWEICMSKLRFQVGSTCIIPEEVNPNKTRLGFLRKRNILIYITLQLSKTTLNEVSKMSTMTVLGSIEFFYEFSNFNMCQFWNYVQNENWWHGPEKWKLSSVPFALRLVSYSYGYGYSMWPRISMSGTALL